MVPMLKLSGQKIEATSLVVRAIAYMNTIWPQPDILCHMKKLFYNEFKFTTNPVTCEPLGKKCVYHWGGVLSIFQ